MKQQQAKLYDNHGKIFGYYPIKEMIWGEDNGEVITIRVQFGGGLLSFTNYKDGNVFENPSGNLFAKIK